MDLVIKGDREMTPIEKKYNIRRFYSQWLQRYEDSWYRPDNLFFTEKIDEETYRILPNTNNVSLIGHIDFTKLEFTSFDEAIEKMFSLKLRR
jgi:hypothetical protein